MPLPVISAALFARFASRQNVVAGDAGGGGAAPAVRRARGEVGRRAVRRPGEHAGPSSGTGSTQVEPAAQRAADVHLRRLAVADFRSWERAELDLEPGVTVLVGPNGVGKTNLVEAAGYLATLGSHRVAADAPLIRRGPSARWSAVWWCTRAGSSVSSWRSPRARPTGHG